MARFTALDGTTGYLSVGTTAVRITTNLVGTVWTPGETFEAGDRVACHTIFVEAHPDNSDLLYLCDTSSPNTTTGVGVVAILIAPFTSNGDLTGLDKISFTLPYAPGGYNASNYYLISDSSSQMAIVSVIVA